MNKIVKACFRENRVDKVYGLTQWDKNRILQIEGLELPEKVQIHFSLDEVGGSALRMWGTTSDGITTVKIPPMILEKENVYKNNYRAFAFVYVTDETSAKTTHKVIFEIKTRPKPDDYVYDPEETKLWSELEKKIEEVEAKSVKTVNNIEPDDDGNVDLTASIEEVAMDLLIQMELAPVVIDADGAIFVDDDGAILLSN